MAHLEKWVSEDMMEPDQDTLKEVMAQKAVELFQMCDSEGKGFITKRDMQRLRDELPVSPDQLEVVFDSLDNDGNGTLTLDEFTEGFGSFLGICSSRGADDGVDDDNGYEEEYEGRAGELDPVLEEKQFKEMLHLCGANKVFDDEDVIKAMWQKLHREEPDLAGTFEEFLAKLASDIKKAKVDFNSLEAALMSKSNEHEEEVKKLYEEMELQIKQEREKILAEEKAKEKAMRENLEQKLKEKEKQLQEILNKHQEMEQRLDQLNSMEAATKQENERLQKERDQLEEMLGQSNESLEESRVYIQQMQLQQKDEKKERARAALMLSEGIAIERESLVKQLDILKDVNKRLRDDKDEAEATDLRRDGSAVSIDEEVKQVTSEPQQDEPKPRKELCKQGSVLGKYFEGGRRPRRSTELVSVDLDADGVPIVDDDDFDDEMLQDATVFIPGKGVRRSQHRSHRHQSISEDEEDGVGSGGKHRNKLMHSSFRSQPIGADALNVSEENFTQKPQRIFKVVFVGDSGVGKSSFIHRFCHHEFKPNFAATIGVDFQVKHLDTKDAMVTLQLWDTAGQERFRSMTKAYFRKADGVIVMYDVTSEATFMNIRNWMSSVEEQVEPGTVVMLLGNKLDMAEDDAHRPVKEKDGMALAVNSEMLFYETSAKTGDNIETAMEEFTSLLQEKEDKRIEEGLKLTEAKPKKRCCSR